MKQQNLPGASNMGDAPKISLVVGEASLPGSAADENKRKSPCLWVIVASRKAI